MALINKINPSAQDKEALVIMNPHFGSYPLQRNVAFTKELFSVQGEGILQQVDFSGGMLGTFGSGIAAKIRVFADDELVYEVSATYFSAQVNPGMSSETVYGFDESSTALFGEAKKSGMSDLPAGTVLDEVRFYQSVSAEIELLYTRSDATVVIRALKERYQVPKMESKGVVIIKEK